jgi:hypothetical protein
MSTTAALPSTKGVIILPLDVLNAALGELKILVDKVVRLSAAGPAAPASSQTRKEAHAGKCQIYVKPRIERGGTDNEVLVYSAEAASLAKNTPPPPSTPRVIRGVDPSTIDPEIR